MAVNISAVKPSSQAQQKGVKRGYELLRLNGHEINDVLDYEFYSKDEVLIADFRTDSGKYHRIRFVKDELEDIGLAFETYLMDKQRHCKNGCIFCFIDQLPKGMRQSLYFKDDDSRLSFLFGNYITLTNLSQHDVDRIIEMHISPVNVSVHTMNKALRVKMMKNKNAGESLDILYRLAQNGIKLNTQLVLCPGINDGKELVYSLEKLGELYPAVESIALVPVGLTEHREKLYELTAYNSESAREVIALCDKFAESFYLKHGTRLAYAADEFYILAGLPIPQEDYYEDYPQIENGVGLWRSVENEFFDALADEEESFKKREISLATGSAAFPLMKKLCESIKEKYKNIHVHVYEIKNDFFGHSITVAGLVTGQDLTAQLTGKPLGEKLLIPSVMLRSQQDMFLDSLTVEEAEKRLCVKIETVSNSGYDLLSKIIG